MPTRHEVAARGGSPPIVRELARLRRRLALAEAVCTHLLRRKLESGPPAPGSLDALLADWERETLR